jgi:predicted AAA+ superfamily ATPase
MLKQSHFLRKEPALLGENLTKEPALFFDSRGCTCYNNLAKRRNSMYRTCSTFLKEWLRGSRRKPLILRGARQVGKTWIVRHLAESEEMKLIEFNFEKNPSLASLFEPNDPHEIMRRISQRFSLTIDPLKTLLFLDEIQAKPQLIAKLRWFYEDMPELPVIAAGSLLEFVLEVDAISMPVGRVSFAYLEPLSFVEFLRAQQKDQLVELIQTYTWDKVIPEAIHDELMRLFKEYIIIGGLPAAVIEWIDGRSLQKVKEVHSDLLGSYRADFSKYNKRISADVLNDLIDSIPRFLGKKFVFSHVESDASLSKIKESLQLLSRARIAHKIRFTAANGLPLGAEVNEKYQKVILLDVGLCSALLNLKLGELEDIEELDMINKGGIAEQVVGQLLRTVGPCYVEPALHYWIRAERGADAEIDYIVQHGTRVIPVEVKAGSSGKLKSLHFFMKIKGLPVAVRFFSGSPHIHDVVINEAQGTTINYHLRSMPLYMVSELHRLLE